MTETYIVFPGGSVELIDKDGDTATEWSAPGLYDDLVLAGYPLHRDDQRSFDATVDVVVEDGRVIACTVGRLPREHPMGDAGRLFLSWLRRAGR